jgi:hypothetical protein
MSQILFVAALLIIVLLALNFEYLVLPSLPASGLGIILVLLGLGIILASIVRKGTNSPPKSESSAADGAPRSVGCAPMIAGSLYLLAGVGVLILQAIGYFH